MKPIEVHKFMCGAGIVSARLELIDDTGTSEFWLYQSVSDGTFQLHREGDCPTVYYITENKQGC